MPTPEEDALWEPPEADPQEALAEDAGRERAALAGEQGTSVADGGGTAAPEQEPAWRRRLRDSSFGQVAVLLVVAFAVAIVAWWSVRPSSEEPAQAESAVMSQVQVDGAGQPPAVGQQAPDFTVQDLDGQELSLAAMRGQPVWLVFAATWCSGCRTEMPDLREAIAAHGEAVRLVVVYTGEDVDTVSAYSRRVGNRFTEVADSTQEVSAAYGVMGVPAHYLIDADGVVRQTHVGLLGSAQVAEALRSVQGG